MADLLVGADVFIGVSAPGLVTPDMVRTMERDAIVFACANPTPEIFPDDARLGGAVWCLPDEAIFQTRSTMYWPSPVCSGVPLTCGPEISMRR